MQCFRGLHTVDFSTLFTEQKSCTCAQHFGFAFDGVIPVVDFIFSSEKTHLMIDDELIFVLQDLISCNYAFQNQLELIETKLFLLCIITF